MDGEKSEDPTLFPATVGEKLRAAREAQGLELSEVAARTRIPQRHLESIEASKYEKLPSVTYAVGFAKSYARAVGMDEVEVGRDVRADLGHFPDRTMPPPDYDPGEAARIFPRGLAVIGVIGALLVLIAAGLYFGTDLFRGSAPPEKETLLIPEAEPTTESDPLLNSATAAIADQVSLIATKRVWIRVSDGDRGVLVEKELGEGERYDVPADAQNPRIRTVGPEKLRVTVNGSVVPPLGAPGRTVETGISAAALKARNQPSATPTGNARPSPTPTASAPSSSRQSAPIPAPSPRAAGETADTLGSGAETTP